MPKLMPNISKNIETSSSSYLSKIQESPLISRDLSWLNFNYRVLDQAINPDRSVFDRLKFLAITSSNLDEFCTIRLGSLYNYIDYAKPRYDYSGLRETPFRELLFNELQKFINQQNRCFQDELKPLFKKNGFEVLSYKSLSTEDSKKVDMYFGQTLFPMLTPMVFDNYHTFPILQHNRLLLGVVTRTTDEEENTEHVSFIQVPGNLPRFFEIEKEDIFYFVPIEEIIRYNIHHLFRNVEVASITLFRINRNGDFTLDESDDIESNFLEELRQKLQTRRTSRVVRVEIQEDPDPWVVRLLKIQLDLTQDNFITIPTDSLIDLTGVRQIINHKEFKEKRTQYHPPMRPLSLSDSTSTDWFEILKKKDVLLHHPYNSMEIILEMLEQAAVNPSVLSIKVTIYRLAKDSRVSAALLKAAEHGKHVSVLFEVKARFDEENNLREAQRLQKAGCFVIYGINRLKTHTKLLLIVRNEVDRVYRYVHLSTGNYNEVTSSLYSDIGMLTTKENFADDVSDFFNVITGHSKPTAYRNLITSPTYMRIQLINFIHQEMDSAKKGLPAGIIIKVNSLQDKELIEALYEASQVGVSIKLIVRGICCLRPERLGLSDNIEVISIVGEYLEHTRIYYFHQQGNPKIYIGSADAMVRSFDRRIESLFNLEDDLLKKEVMNILLYNLRDNVNSYVMKEDGSYERKKSDKKTLFNIHREFFMTSLDSLDGISLFSFPVPADSVKS